MVPEIDLSALRSRIEVLRGRARVSETQARAVLDLQLRRLSPWQPANIHQELAEAERLRSN